MHTEQSTVGCGSLAAHKARTTSDTLTPRKRHARRRRFDTLAPRSRIKVCFKLPRPLSSPWGAPFPVVPALKALQSRRRREREESPPATEPRPARLPLSSVYSRRALRCRTLGPRTYSLLSRENVSNKLWPSSSCVAGAAILHTQGGLQKYVGGTTCDVTSVRGLVLENTTAEQEIFFIIPSENINM